MRTLLQAAWVPGGLGTGAGRGLLGGLGTTVDTQSETEVVALPLVA